MKTLFKDHTFTALRRALDALSLRHEVIADNIANVNTPGFKARHVLFEDELRSAISRGDPGSARPTIEVDMLRVRRDGNSVDVDLEMAKLAETTVLYGALTRLVSERFALLRAAINQGRR